jgi:hypothetical protein
MEAVLGATRITGPDVCRRVLLVGEINPYGGQPGYALYHEPTNSAGGRLQRLVLGLDARRWYLPLWRVNLCVGSWDDDEARGRAVALTRTSAPWRTIVLLGDKVRSAFFGARLFRQKAQPFTVLSVATVSAETTVEFSALALPHPSGRNAANWTSDNVTRARRMLRDLEPSIPWGQLDERAPAEATP